MTYLLDTNAWVNYLNNPSGPVGTELAALQPADLYLCSVVLGELLTGGPAMSGKNPAADAAGSPNSDRRSGQTARMGTTRWTFILSTTGT
jgi:hypothetical protein